MIRIEYKTPATSLGMGMNHVMFVDSFEEADEICNKCDQYGYDIVDVSNYIEEPEDFRDYEF